ncbi:MAG: dihydrolipoamide acetyltransferase family protein [Candidatus Adiutrix sp.]
MTTEIKMPQLGLTMTEGTIGTWHKKIGDTINIGDILVDVQTDKLTSELASEFEGTLLAIVAQEGDEVPVQGLLAVIGNPGETVELAAAPVAPAAAPVAAAAPPSLAPAMACEQTQGGRVRISPLAKKEALAQGLDFSRLIGTGPSGRIVHKDVLLALKSTPAPVVSANDGSQTFSSTTRTRMPAMRKRVAERMLKSHLEIPTVTQTMKIDVTQLMAFRQEINAGREVPFSINDLVLKGVAKALAANKHVLTSIEGHELLSHNEVNLGMAVALDDGLIVPVIKQADKMNLETLAAKAKDLAGRARLGQLSLDEYQGATFSVSNLGMFGVESFTPIINQPDAAILGICSIEDELALADEKVIVRKIMRISMTYDHRIMDGVVAAKFQLAIKALLEKPLDIIL